MTTQLSSEPTVAVEELQAFLDAGEPWPAEICARLSQCPPARQRAILHALRVRTLLRAPFAQAANLHPHAADLNDLLHQPARQNLATKIRELIILLQWQFQYLIHQATEQNRRQLWHTFQVQVQPPRLRQRMGRFLGLTFLPGRRRHAFVPGEQFVPLSFLRALTLTVRPHRLANGQVIDMFDVKLHLLQLDVESGALLVGGPGTVLAKYFSFTPARHPGRQTLSLDNVAVLEGALALHEAMEQAAIDGVGAQTAPVFPEVFLGFRARDEMAVEYSEALQRQILRQTDAWCRRGRPTSWPELPGLTELNGSLGRPPRSWPEMVAQVGEPTGKFLQEQAWDQSIVEQGGLVLVPAGLFEPYSAQRPVRRAWQTFAHLPPHLMGREVTAAAGERRLDDNLARAQVIWRHHLCRGGCPPEQSRPGLPGPTDNIDYDFTSVPLGLERFFTPARNY